MLRYLFLLLTFITTVRADEVTQPFTPIPYTIKIPIDKDIENIDRIEVEYMVDLDTYQYQYSLELNAENRKDSYTLAVEYIYCAEICEPITTSFYVNVPLGAWVKTKDHYVLKLIPNVCYDENKFGGDVWLHIIQAEVTFR